MLFYTKAKYTIFHSLRKMKIAIIGCGQIADAHIQESLKIDGVKVVGVCDSNIFMAKQLALRFGIPGRFTDIKKMLQEIRPDIVHITTPPASHLPIAKVCLENGAHLYIEKPFAVNVSEAKEIIRLAEKMGKLVCVGHNCVFDSAYQRLLKMQEDRKLGEISHLEAAMGYNLNGPFGAILMGDPNHWLHALPGGLAQNNISHPISLILGMMPGENIQTRALGYRFRPERYGDIRDVFFDEIRVILVSGNVTANLTFSSRSRPVQTFITAYGTRCAANASLDSRTLRITSGAQMPGPFAKVHWAARDTKESLRELYYNSKKLVTAKLHYFEGMGELFRQFYNAVEGKQEIPIPMTEALRVTTVMDAIIHECKANECSVSYGGKA